MEGPVDVDVAVVGAGPAGCAAAVTLARAGVRVALLDRARFPRQKTCGDGLTTGALRRLERLRLDLTRVPSFAAVGALSVRSPSGRTISMPFRDDGIFAAVARRSELDAALVDLARESGAGVYERSRCTALDEDGAGLIVVRTADGPVFRSGHVIACDGAWSAIRHIIDERQRQPAPAARPQWLAQRGYVNRVRAEARDRMWVWFPKGLLPGYAWSFPLADGSANVGVSVASPSGRSLVGAWRSTMGAPFLDSLLEPGARLAEPSRAWPIPTGLSPESLVSLGGRVLFAGDAAGAADPFTGEGIAQALEGGVLAARSIADAASTGGIAGSYVEETMTTLGRDHTVAAACQRLFGLPSGARAALGFAGTSNFMRRNVGRWLFEDYPRSAFMSPETWKEALERRPGPFARSTRSDQSRLAPLRRTSSTTA